MKKCNYFLFITLFLTNFILCQENDTLKIKGTYHPFKHAFNFEEITPHPISDAYINYSANMFIQGISVVRKEHFFYTQIDGVEKSQKIVNYGVIDTSGNLLIPCKYDNLFQIQREGWMAYFYYHSNDSVTLIDVFEKKIIVLRKDSPKIPKSIFYDTKTSFIRIDLKGNLILKYNGRYQLYNVNNNKFIIPTFLSSHTNKNEIEQMNYEMIEDKERFVIYSNTPYDIDYFDLKDYPEYFDNYGSSLDHFVYDKEDECYSERFKLVTFYNDSLLFLQDTNGNSFLTKNPCYPKNVYNFDYIEIFPSKEVSHLFFFSQDHSRDIRLTNFKKPYYTFLLVRKNDKYGIINIDSTVLVPIEYEDIYIINDSLLWVKKNDFWAVCTINNLLLTDFEFIDIEKMSKVYFDNLMYYTRTEHSMVGKTYHRYLSDRAPTISFINECAGLIKRFEKSHNYYTNLVDGHFIARKNDGYHFLTINDTLNKIEIDSIHYDNIYLAPGNRPGLNVGGKYGVEPDDIKYDGVLIDLNPFAIYDYYGSENHPIYLSSELIIKKGKIYGFLKGTKRKKRLIHVI